MVVFFNLVLRHGQNIDPSEEAWWGKRRYRQVHEYWAQVALEFGDFKQFDQAAAQLEAPPTTVWITALKPSWLAVIQPYDSTWNTPWGLEGDVFSY